MPSSDPSPTMPSSDPSPAERGLVELQLDGLAHGGEAVGRLPGGKACFVAYAIPGERVLVEVTESRRRWARARLVEVLDPSPSRVEPPCPYFGPSRCGGCRLQHVEAGQQAQMKRRILVEQLQRIGGIDDPPVAETVRAGEYGYRREARFAVDDHGRLGFRRTGTGHVIPIDHCLLLTDEAQALRAGAGDEWSGVEEVSVRTGAGAGDGVLVVRPGSGPVGPLPATAVPVALVDDLGQAVPLRGETAITETVAGLEFQVSPTSFFQASRAGAEALLSLVLDAAGAQAGDLALDLFSGVGLFARGLSAAGADVIAVESHPAACADARSNLAGCDPVPAVWECEADAAIARARSEQLGVDLIVLDPPRRGAGVELSAALAELAPRRIVYVSCDPAALARDARALGERGYRLAHAVPVDQFAQTAAIEAVATFDPA
ncbi:MAG TPA: class I SAM-dependent RNA methyltransferase [Egibacteraceae bacterium]|nr:class I SAM-dependent RNA methyltransferase [Egibacteraceae bacterium]